MNPTIETLTALQELTARAAHPATNEEQAAIAQLRAKLPVAVVVYFDRRVARGRSVVAGVRNGVCLSCHLRVPVGTVASLVSATSLVTCENCGSYLSLAPDEGAFLPEASGANRVTVRRMKKQKSPVKATVLWPNEPSVPSPANAPTLVTA